VLDYEMWRHELLNLGNLAGGQNQSAEKLAGMEREMESLVSAVTTNRPARVESNQPVNFRKFAFSFQKTPRNALLWSFLE
jgi:hypothetical protein